MALFVSGVKCVLCGLPMAADEEVVMFSPFVANKRDPLFRFSDAPVHAACLRGDPRGNRAVELHEAAMRSADIGKRLCDVCGQPISDPDDYLGLGLLTSDPGNPLFRFNFRHLHRSHIGQWERYEEFRRLVEAMQASEAWDGPRLVFADRPKAEIHWTRAPAN
jgi:hypothetical protein